MRHEPPMQLRRHLSAVLSKQAGQAIAVCGELGLGKTFALKNLLAETPCNHLYLEIYLTELELLKALPEANLPAKLQKQIDNLSQADELSPLVFELLLAKFEVLSPFILVIENVHKLSFEHLKRLKELAQGILKLRGIGLFVSSRGFVPTPFKTYWLVRPGLADLKDLLESQVNTSLPSEGLDWVFAKTLGNPLFALEFWRYLSQQGYFWSDGSRWHWRMPQPDFLPPSLRAMIYDWANLVDLGSQAKQALELRTLLPEPLDEHAWADVAGLEPPLFKAIQNQWESLGITRNAQFSHPLISQIIKESISPKQRMAFAGQALAKLEALGVEPSAQLIADANLDKAKTLQIYEKLAAQAKAANELAKAGHWLGLAAESNLDFKLSLALEAAQLLRHSDLDRALELAQLAANSPPHDPEAVYLCAELKVIKGSSAEAESILDLLSPQERKTQRWWETLIRLQYATHANYEEVLQLWQDRPELQPQASAETQLYIAAVLGQGGQFDEAFALSQPLLKQDELEPFLRCRLLELEALFYYLRGHSQEASNQNAEAVALARQLERPLYLAQLLRKEGIYAENVGSFAYRTSCYREALEILRNHGSPLDQANLEAILASALADQGDYQEAENLLLKALVVLEPSDNKLMHCDCCIGLALLYLDWQPRYGEAMALRHARLALELAEQVGNQQMLHSSLTTLALTEASGGNAEHSLELAETSLAETYTASSEIRRARSLYAFGMACEAMNQADEAIAKLSESIQLHADLDIPEMAQRVGLELDRITKNAESALKRKTWFEAQGLLGGASIALRYFPSEQKGAVLETVAVPRLCLLGPALLETQGKVSPYRGRKRLELLAFLLETRVMGKTEASLLELMDALYPDTDEAGAKAILKQLVYLLRNQLGAQAILSTASGYALGKLETDVEAFLKTGESSLFRANYLDGLGEACYPEVQEKLLDSLKQVALEKLGQNPQETFRLADIWQQMEPYDLEALSLGLDALDRLGDKRKLERFYEQGLKRFKDVGESLPKSAGEFLQDFVTKV